MRRIRFGRLAPTLLRALAAMALLAPPSLAQSPPPAAQPAAQDSVRRVPGADTAMARDLIKNGDYDRAIEVLRSIIASGPPTEELREAYLQLIKTYVFLGNDYKFRPQGRELSNLNYREAQQRIAEVLRQPALRHTRPEPATDYPPEMIAFFAQVRSELFGGFRVIGLDPPAAVVTFDGDPLAAADSTGARVLEDLPIGAHAVVIQAPGHKTFKETVTISPNATLERRYRLEKRRGPLWYGSRVAGAIGAVAGVIALTGKGGGTATEQPLPEAPPPPTR